MTCVILRWFPRRRRRPKAMVICGECGVVAFGVRDEEARVIVSAHRCPPWEESDTGG